MYLNIITFFCLMLSAATLGKLGRIIGGDNADIVEFPHQVSLRHMVHNYHVCGGTIISHQHVLTAAHCVFKREVHYPYLRIQSGLTTSRGNMVHMHEIENIFIHPEYSGKMNQRKMNVHDIAVIKLKYGIEFNEYQNKANLPSRDVRAGERGMISGWGVLNYPSDVYSERLQKAPMTILDKNDCKNRVQANIEDSQFCALQGLGVGPCAGDSGGPMTRNGQIIIGIVSLSHPCALGLPDIYTNVFFHVDFIKHAMGY